MNSISCFFLLLLVGSFGKQVLAVKSKHGRNGPATAEAESVPRGGGHDGLIVRKLKGKSSKSSGSFEVSTVANGEQEVPEVMTETEAELELSFNEAFNEVEFDLDVFDGEDIILAHLHCALAGTNGPVVVTLFEDTDGEDVDGSLVDGTIANADIMPQMCGNIEVNNIASLYEAVLQRQVYLNVHSQEFPAGVVRGQVFP